MRTHDMTDKVDFVTGAGTGMGAAAALALASRGADIAIVGRRERPLEGERLINL